MNKKIEKLPNYHLAKVTCPKGLNLSGRIQHIKDMKSLIMWEKVNEIIVMLNNPDKDKSKDILIEVSRMIEKRTGKE